MMVPPKGFIAGRVLADVSGPTVPIDSSPYEIWYDGERLFPPAPREKEYVRQEYVVLEGRTDEERRLDMSYPRNRAERRAQESQKRKRR